LSRQKKNKSEKRGKHLSFKYAGEAREGGGATQGTASATTSPLEHGNGMDRFPSNFAKKAKSHAIFQKRRKKEAFRGGIVIRGCRSGEADETPTIREKIAWKPSSWLLEGTREGDGQQQRMERSPRTSDMTSNPSY